MNYAINVVRSINLLLIMIRTIYSKIKLIRIFFINLLTQILFYLRFINKYKLQAGHISSSSAILHFSKANKSYNFFLLVLLDVTSFEMI